MGPVPFAFSVHHFINSVGAYCGFAAFLGLGLLALLYFAQARETATLREHAYEAAQRIQQLDARIAQLVRSAPAPAQPAASERAPAPAAAQQRRPAAVPAGVARAPAVVGAPAGVGAPALTAATKLIPTDVPSTELADAEPDEQPSDDTEWDPAVPAPAAATAAAVGSNGSNHERIPPPAAASATLPPPPRVQIRPGGAAQSARRPAPPPTRSQASGRGIPRGFVFLLAGLAIVAVVAVLLIVTSSGGNSPAANAGRTTNAPSGAQHVKHVAFSPASVTVSVLNGTSTSGLAHRVALKLGAAGYKQGNIVTASDQTHTTTVVQYLPGHRSEALHVAQALNLNQSSVQSIDSSTQAVACPPPAGCASTVVVTVGADLANTT